MSFVHNLLIKVFTRLFVYLRLQICSNLKCFFKFFIYNSIYSIKFLVDKNLIFTYFLQFFLHTFIILLFLRFETS